MQKINLTNEMIKRLESNEYYSKEDFIRDCQTYIKALKSGRLQYRVTSVSSSGMSRDILISSFEGSMAKGYYRNYTSMLEVLGFNFISMSFIFDNPTLFKASNTDSFEIESFNKVISS